MTHGYELVCILRADGTEDQNKQLVTRIEDLIKKEGGTITATEPWGRRRFAFPIKKQREGLYVLVTLQAEPTVIDRVKRSFRLDESIVRVMITRVEPGQAAAAAQARTTAVLTTSREEGVR